MHSLWSQFISNKTAFSGSTRCLVTCTAFDKLLSVSLCNSRSVGDADLTFGPLMLHMTAAFCSASDKAWYVNLYLLLTNYIQLEFMRCDQKGKRCIKIEILAWRRHFRWGGETRGAGGHASSIVAWSSWWFVWPIWSIPLALWSSFRESVKHTNTSHFFFQST